MEMFQQVLPVLLYRQRIVLRDSRSLKFWQLDWSWSWSWSRWLMWTRWPPRPLGWGPLWRPIIHWRPQTCPFRLPVGFWPGRGVQEFQFRWGGQQPAGLVWWGGVRVCVGPARYRAVCPIHVGGAVPSRPARREGGGFLVHSGSC